MLFLFSNITSHRNINQVPLDSGWNNIAEYRKITFNNETLVPATVLTAEIFGADRVINVNSTVGCPDNYGLLKIDEEIMVHTSKTATTFEGCARGFSGIDKISKENAAEFLNFSKTLCYKSLRSSALVVQNLSNLFLQQFFTKFKSEFLPGFENRSFVKGTSVANVLTKQKTFIPLRVLTLHIRFFSNFSMVKILKLSNPLRRL